MAERTRTLNRLHGLLRDLVPGGVARPLSADRAAYILRGLRPRGGASARLRRRLASEVLRDVRTLDRSQARSDARGGAYYRKKLAEGKSRKEALRCLKRRVSDAAFKSLVADWRAHSRSAA